MLCHANSRSKEIILGEVGNYLKLAQRCKLHRGKIAVLEILTEAWSCIARSTVTSRTGWYDLILQQSQCWQLKKKNAGWRTHRFSRVIAFLPSFKIKWRDFDYQYLVGMKEPTKEFKNRLKSLGSSCLKWLFACVVFSQEPQALVLA